MKAQFGQIQRPVFAAVVLLLAVPAVLQAFPVLKYEATLTTAPPMVRPNAVTFTPLDQSICVTDEALVALAVFDERGFHRFQTNAISRVSSPRDGCIDARGDFVYTGAGESSARTIKRLNFLGEPQAYDPEPPQDDWSPQHLLIARDGGYITLDPSGVLAKHAPDTGKLIWKLQVVDAADELADVMGRPAEAPDGRIYIPYSGGNTILVVSPEGHMLTAFGEQGSKRGNLAFPVGVAFGSEDQILILDRMRHKILIFDSNHKFVTEFGRLGYGSGEIYHPVAITASSDGRVWVAQGFKGRVQMFRLRDSESIPETSDHSGPAHNTKGEKQ